VVAGFAGSGGSALSVLPDLQIALSPSIPKSLPQTFTVSNKGGGPAQAASLLKVKLELQPISGYVPQEDPYGQPPSLDDCKKPLQDFEQVIPPLAPGHSQIEGKNTALIASITAQPGPPPAGEQNSYYKVVRPTLVCVWKMTATIDSTEEVDESNEGNNTVVHYAHVEVQ
jgi:hypothetical protein